MQQLHSSSLDIHSLLQQQEQQQTVAAAPMGVTLTEVPHTVGLLQV